MYHDYFDWQSELYTMPLEDEKDIPGKDSFDLIKDKISEAISFLEMEDQITLRLYFAFLPFAQSYKNSLKAASELLLFCFI